MFLQHFGLTEDAFGVTPDPKFLYFGREHREALSSLYYSIVEGRGFAVMVAAPGMGKTTLLHYLRDRMKDRAEFVLLTCAFDDRHELLQAVMAALNVESESGSYFQNWRRLESFLLKKHEQQGKIVLVCDEAQSLGTATLENIRLLSNLETTGTKLLQIILAGQPALAQELQTPGLEQLAQRINVFCRIRPLDEAEVDTYIGHRLEVAGRNRRVFTEEAVAAIARTSQGIPRNINTLCYNAMALSWAQGRRLVSEEQVQGTVCDLSLADPSSDWAAGRASICGGAHSSLPEPAALELSWPRVPPNGSPARMKLAAPNNQVGPVLGDLPAQLSEMLQKLERLTVSMEKLSGMVRALPQGEDVENEWSKQAPVTVEP